MVYVTVIVCKNVKNGWRHGSVTIVDCVMVRYVAKNLFRLDGDSYGLLAEAEAMAFNN